MNSIASSNVIVIGIVIILFVYNLVLRFVFSIIATDQINHPTHKKFARAAIISFVYNTLVAIVFVIAGKHPRMLVPFIIIMAIVYLRDKE